MMERGQDDISEPLLLYNSSQLSMGESDLDSFGGIFSRRRATIFTTKIRIEPVLQPLQGF
jgi:hypothetical protein